MELKYGDDVEVRDFKNKPWEKGYKFLAHDQLSTNEPCSYLVSDGGRYHCFKYCRPARPDLEIDDKVWVKDGSEWLPKHFAGWAIEGFSVIFCWMDGGTSHTQTTKIAWRTWSLTPPEDEDEV